jgi:hypothetical protein
VSSSTTKKVIVERFDRPVLRGYCNPQDFLRPEGVEFLAPGGNVAIIPFDQIKVLSFVRDLEGQGVLGERREFIARPKSAGLWVSVSFKDGAKLEGLHPNNLLSVEASGYSLSPPEASGNAQKVFIPRQAVREIVVLGVIGNKRHPRATPEDTRQIALFPGAQTG